MSELSPSVCKQEKTITSEKIRSVRLYYAAAVFFILFCFEGRALAGECYINKFFLNERVSFGVSNVSGSLPIGSVIKEVRTTPANIMMGSCQGVYQYGAELIYATVPTNIRGVYKTNLDGVGIKVSGLYSDHIDNKKSYKYYGAFDKRTVFGYFTPITVQIIKTGPITPGVLNNGKLVSFKWVSYSGRAHEVVAAYISGINKINVNACILRNDNVINVNMNQVKKSAFGEVGSTAGKTKFNISLFCEKDALIQLSFSPPAEGSPDSNNGLINIKKQSNGAEGVGIQLLYDDNTPVVFNRKKTIAQYAAAGDINIPMVAQYYKKNEPVVGGKADGYVTFTITHQ